MTLSCVILTKNNEKTIRYALESVAAWIDELVIVDCGSTDDTLTITRNYTSHILYQEFTSFSRQRNFGLDQCTGDYVMFLDSDEVVGENFPALRDYLSCGYQTLYLPRYNLISLDPLEYLITKHHYRNWQPRVIRNNGVSRYGDDIVHEKLTQYRPRLHCTATHLFHLDYLLHSYEVRQQKVDFYENLAPHTGYPEYYLFEDYPYRTALTLERPAEKILTLLKADKTLRQHVYPSHRSPLTQATQYLRWNAYKALTKLRVFVHKS